MENISIFLKKFVFKKKKKKVLNPECYGQYRHWLWQGRFLAEGTGCGSLALLLWAHLEWALGPRSDQGAAPQALSCPPVPWPALGREAASALSLLPASEHVVVGM